MVCKFNLVNEQKLKQKKVDIFGGTPFWPLKNKINSLKKISHLLIPYNAKLLFQNTFLL